MFMIMILLSAVHLSETRFTCETGGRLACMTSCRVQGCNTGYCINDVCTCSRCH